MPADPENITYGDPISFVLNGQGATVTHRVVDVDREERSFTTRGDANEVDDGAPVLYENVLGIVRFHIPVVGYALGFVLGTTGKIVAATVIVSLILLTLFLGGIKKEVVNTPLDGTADSYLGERAMAANEHPMVSREYSDITLKKAENLMNISTVTREKHNLSDYPDFDPDFAESEAASDISSSDVYRPQGISNKKVFAALDRRNLKFSSKVNATLFIAIVACVLVGGTFAVLSAVTGNEAINEFTVGEIGIDIDEDFDPLNPWNIKRVMLTNNDTENAVPGVARAKIVPVLRDEDTGEGRAADMGSILAAPTGTRLYMGDVVFVFDTNWATNWFFKDGFFYYRRVLNPGETTEPLLHKVELRAGAELEKYEGKILDVEVLASIIQAESNAPAEWGVVVTGTVVSG